MRYRRVWLYIELLKEILVLSLQEFGSAGKILDFVPAVSKKPVSGSALRKRLLSYIAAGRRLGPDQHR
jgi:hypothetical protein